jgi:hypothetical protein
MAHGNAVTWTVEWGIAARVAKTRATHALFNSLQEWALRNRGPAITATSVGSRQDVTRTETHIRMEDVDNRILQN